MSATGKNKFLILPISIAVIMAAMLFWCMPASAQKKERLSISFTNRVNGRLLEFDSVTYTNKLKQQFTVTMLKYYISNIKLTDSVGRVYESRNSYFLIDQEKPESMRIELSDIPVGHFSKISFLLGVDSLHNCNGAQDGALDPVNAMFWTWNTGYIFLKMEGKTKASKLPGNIFEYHIGGYKEPANCIRKIELDLYKDRETYSDMVPIDHSSEANKSLIENISIVADPTILLSSATDIDFSQLSSVTDFHNATIIADNYKNMFKIEHLVYVH